VQPTMFPLYLYGFMHSSAGIADDLGAMEVFPSVAGNSEGSV